MFQLGHISGISRSAHSVLRSLVFGKYAYNTLWLNLSDHAAHLNKNTGRSPDLHQIEIQFFTKKAIYIQSMAQNHSVNIPAPYFGYELKNDSMNFSSKLEFWKMPAVGAGAFYLSHNFGRCANAHIFKSNY